MIYIFHLLDKPGASELRAGLRPQHKAYLGAVADRIAFAGPLVSDEGTTMIGSVLAIEFASRQDATSWIAAEPFNRSGLYAGVMIHAFVNLWPQRVGFPDA